MNQMIFELQVHLRKMFALAEGENIDKVSEMIRIAESVKTQ